MEGDTHDATTALLRRRGSEAELRGAAAHGLPHATSRPDLGTATDWLRMRSTAGSDAFGNGADDAVDIRRSTSKASAPASRQQRLSVAAIYMIDGRHARSTSHGTGAEAQQSYRRYHSRRWVACFAAVATLHCMLAFAEAPALRRANGYPAVLTGLAELAAAAFYTADAVFRCRVDGNRWLYRPWGVARCAATACVVVNAVLSLAIPQARYGGILRVARPVPLLHRLRNVRSVASAVMLSVRRLLAVLALLTLLIFTFSLVAFAMFSGLSFGDGGCARDKPPPEHFCSVYDQTTCTDYFATLPSSAMHLFVLLTTANYPDVMMPAYNCNEFASLFFIVYLVLGTFFLLNLVLAVAYDSFQEHAKVRVARTAAKRGFALREAFRLLREMGSEGVPTGVDDTLGRRDSTSSTGGVGDEDGDGKHDGVDGGRSDAASHAMDEIQSKHPNTALQQLVLAAPGISAYVTSSAWEDAVSGYVTKDTWCSVMRLVRPSLPAEVLPVLFDLCDSEQDGTLRLSEFQRVAAISEVEVTDEDDGSALLRRGVLPVDHDLEGHRLRFMQLRVWLRKVLYSRPASAIWLITILVNAVAAAVDVSNQRADVVRETSATTVQLWTLVIFSTEVLLKAVAVGLRNLWNESLFARIDIISVFGSLTFHAVYDVFGLQSWVTQALTLLRLSRLLRLMEWFEAYRDIVMTFSRIVPALLRFVVLAVSVEYAFAIVGMSVFSGELTPQNVNHTAYHSLNYGERNNFDSMGTAMVTLFEQTVVNNWPIVMEACVAAVGERARVFFMLHYTTVALVLINVLVALTMDTFITYHRGASFRTQEAALQDAFAAKATEAGHGEHRWSIRMRLHLGAMYENMFAPHAQAALQEAARPEAATEASTAGSGGGGVWPAPTHAYGALERR